jgi:hypothetical protein
MVCACQGSVVVGLSDSDSAIASLSDSDSDLLFCAARVYRHHSGLAPTIAEKWRHVNFKLGVLRGDRRDECGWAPAATPTVPAAPHLHNDICTITLPLHVV